MQIHLNVALTAVLICVAASAHAVDTRVDIELDPPQTREGFRSEAWAISPSESLFLLDRNRLLRDFGPAHDIDSALLSGLPPSLGSGRVTFVHTQGASHLVSRDDNHLLATYTVGCEVIHMHGNGRRTWRASALAGDQCLFAAPLVLTDRYVLFVRPLESPNLLTAIAMDLQGRRIWQTELPVATATSAEPFALAHDSGFVAAPGSGPGLELFALDTEGTLRWHWPGDPTHEWTLADLRIENSGAIRAVAIASDGGASILQFSDDGGEPVRHQLATEDGFTAVSARLRDDGGLYVGGIQASEPGQALLIGYSDPEIQDWQRPAPCTYWPIGSATAPVCRAQIVNQDELLLASADPEGGVEWIRSDGSQRLRITHEDPDLVERVIHSHGFAATGQLVVVVRFAPPTLIDRPQQARERIDWYNASGHLIERRLIPNGAPEGPPYPAGSVLDAQDHLRLVHDGLVHRDGGRRLSIDPDGLLTRTTPLPEALQSVPQLAVTVCADESDCVANRFGEITRIMRFDDDQVDWIWQRQAVWTHGRNLLRATISGATDLISRSDDEHGLMRMDEHGQIIVQRSFPVSAIGGEGVIAHAYDGRFAVLVKGRLHRFDADGSEHVIADSLPPAYPDQREQIAGTITANGSVWYLAVGGTEDGNGRSPLHVVHVRANGTAVQVPVGSWPAPVRTTYSFPADDPTPRWLDRYRIWPVSAQILVHRAGGILIGIEQHLAGSDDDRFELRRLDADGRLIWHRSWNNGDEHRFELHVDAGRLALGSRRDNGSWIMRALDDEGHLIDQRLPHCGTGPCLIDHMHLAVDGDVVGVGRSGTDQPAGYRVWRLRSLFDPPQALRLEHPGLTGTWYDPAVPGQGFTLRTYTDPGGTTVFMPWFTFHPHGGNETSHLRWYTIQGRVEPGQNEANLLLLANSGGRFDTPPTTEPQPVGTVRLRFPDCTRGVLEYRFDPVHGGAQGSIALQRLLPPELACNDLEPAAHDPLLSASWYDPATSGQGLDLYRLAGDDSAPGLLFGSWYTYAPGTPSGTQTDQRWFTLQDIADGGDGGWTTTIVQTLGGRLDGQPTWNHFRVGEALLHSQDCQRLLLRYRFDDSDAAGDFRALEGSIQLQRIGACPEHL